MKNIMLSEEKQRQEDLKKIDRAKFTVMFILGVVGTSLLLSGFFIDKVFTFLDINLNKTMLYIFKIAFYGSGFLDFWLINYVRKNL